MILVIDFGGQYNQLIARRVRDLNVYCEVVPYTKALEEIKAKSPDGVIFTGGPNSVYAEDAPKIEKEVFELGIPILGLCYGMQLMAHSLGGEVKESSQREFGKTEFKLEDNEIFKDIPKESIVWMSHVDKVVKLPEGFKIIGSTDNTEIAAMTDERRKLYALQFHPEVNHSEYGIKMIENFLVNICNVKQEWTMAN